eukprot:m.63267 g.63267  ORF g.63267 m.63267 type:complete len:410 (-) comp13963_c1_seq3:62-1291(-)
MFRITFSVLVTMAVCYGMPPMPSSSANMPPTIAPSSTRSHHATPTMPEPGNSTATATTSTRVSSAAARSTSTSNATSSAVTTGVTTTNSTSPSSHNSSKSSASHRAHSSSSTQSTNLSSTSPLSTTISSSTQSPISTSPHSTATSNSSNLSSTTPHSTSSSVPVSTSNTSSTTTNNTSTSTLHPTASSTTTVFVQDVFTLEVYSDPTCSMYLNTVNVTEVSPGCLQTGKHTSVTVASINCRSEGVSWLSQPYTTPNCSGQPADASLTYSITATDYTKYLSRQCATRNDSAAVFFFKATGRIVDVCNTTSSTTMPTTVPGSTTASNISTTGSNTSTTTANTSTLPESTTPACPTQRPCICTTSAPPAPKIERASSGTIAGVAVGCLLAGLLFGAGGAFFLFSRGRNYSTF